VSFYNIKEIDASAVFREATALQLSTPRWRTIGLMETILTVAAFVVVWTVLQSWLLPKFGVPT
jgi:uncharacterized DUF497 family protein